MNVYFDLDECLIHCEVRPFPEQTHRFMLEDGEYFLALRPQAVEAIECARRFVGNERVFILTTSVRDYARTINTICSFGFDKKNILTREDLNSYMHRVRLAYASHKEISPHPTANKRNKLIDNLPMRDNEDKISFIGINPKLNVNYLQVTDYWGVNFPKDHFKEKVIEFLKARE